MQQWIELNTKIANDSLAFLKHIGELNVKTTEAFLAQQKELTESFAATAEQNIEKLTAVKEPKEFLEIQNELLQSSVTSAIGNWKKAVATSTANRDAYSKLAEKSAKTAKSNMEQVVESVKQTTEAAKKAVKTSAK